MIQHSKKESELLSLKIGRIETDILQNKDLFREIIKREYDLIRLKVDSKQFHINHQIEKLGFPSYYCGSISKYEMYFFDLPKPIFKNEHTEFVFYTPAHKEVLYDLIVDSFKSDPLGYYKNPLISQFLTKEEEIHAMATYYIEQLNKEKNKMVFLKKNEKFAGFISIFLKDNNIVDTPISGVAKAFRGQAIFDDLRSFRHKYCLENNIHLGLAGARSENLYSQKTFLNDGMKYVGNESIYQITPLLSKKQKESHTNTFTIKPSNLQGALAEFQEKIILEHNGLISQNEFYFVAGKTCIVYPFLPSKSYHLIINIAIKSSNKILTVSKICDDNMEIRLVVYSQFQCFE